MDSDFLNCAENHVRTYNATIIQREGCRLVEVIKLKLFFYLMR